MERINYDIRSNYNTLTDLLTGSKYIINNRIFLKKKKSNVKWFSEKTDVQHDINDDYSIELIVGKQREGMKYSIQLRSKELSEEPFFRFDSSGGSHRVTIDGSNKNITTPHFHKFDQDGRNIAYKTDVLLDEKKRQSIVEDINLGVHYFFSQTNLSVKDKDSLPEIVLEQLSLFPEEDITDPFLGKKFD